MAIGQKVTVLVNGYNLACALKSYETKSDVDVLDATVLCNSYKSFEQGFKNGTFTASGVWDYNRDTLEDKIHEVMTALYDSGDEVNVVASKGEVAIGSVAEFFKGTVQKYGIKDELGQLIMVDCEIKVNGAIGYGLFMLSQQIDEGEVDWPSIDNGVATDDGGIFTVQIQNDDATDVVVTLQHSDDDTVWVDLIDTGSLSDPFASVTLNVPEGTTVEQYTRVLTTVSGGNTFLISAAFARR